MYFNKSYDGGTFEESTPLQKFQYWLELRGQAQWQMDVFMSIDRHDLATRYYKLMNYIEYKMRKIQ